MIRMRYVMVLVWLLGGSVASAQNTETDTDWPQWRGPAGTGHTHQTKPPTHWSDTEQVRWKTAIPGRGHSTPIVSGEFVFLTTAVAIGDKLPPKMSGRPGEHDNLPVDSKYQFVVLAIDRSTGDRVWQTVVREAIPVEGGHKSASLASASIVTDGTHVYAFFGSFGLYCLDLTGKVIWERQFGQLHSKHGHGEGASPALYGDSIVVNCDHEDQSFVIAMKTTTGKTLWRRDREEVTSWSTPIIVEHAGRQQVIVAGTQRVRSYDLTSGDEIWQCGGMSANICATPVYSQGVLVVGSSYEKRILIAIQLEGAAGDITESPNVLWSTTRRTPYVPSMLLVEDGLYFLAHYQNVLTRLELKTGRDAPGAMRLGELSNIYASPVAAGKNIYITDLDGTTLVLAAGVVPRAIAVNRIHESVNASLAIAGNHIFIRGEKHLFCIGE